MSQTKKELQVYLEALEVQAKQEKKEDNGHNQWVTKQNATLIVLIQLQQQKVNKLMA